MKENPNFKINKSINNLNTSRFNTSKLMQTEIYILPCESSEGLVEILFVD